MRWEGIVALCILCAVVNLLEDLRKDNQLMKEDYEKLRAEGHGKIYSAWTAFWK